MMAVSRDQVVQRVRQAGFTFKKQGARVDIYRQQGTKQRVALPRRDLYDERLVRIVLGQAGLTQREIQDFLKSAVKHD